MSVTVINNSGNVVGFRGQNDPVNLKIKNTYLKLIMAKTKDTLYLKYSL